MKSIFIKVVLLFPLLSFAEEVVWSEGITLSKQELQFALKNSVPKVVEGLRTDEASRYEYLVNLLIGKKIKAELDAISPDEASELYIEYLFALLEASRNFDQMVFQRQLELPDLGELALERYRVSKDVIASVPAIREASHILLLCGTQCDEESKRAELEVIRDRVLQGEPFDELATEFSQDPGSKLNGGRLSRGIAEDAANVDQSVRDALFALKEIGDISEVVQSRFGFHVIKLESVSPARVRSFEEVEQALTAEIERRYREDAYQQRVMSLAPTEPLQVDTATLNRLMGTPPDPSVSE